MGCIFEESMTGICSMSTDDDGKPCKKSLQQGADENAICMVSDDPDPADSCDTYESDWMCHECGVDLNVEDSCECDDQ